MEHNFLRIEQRNPIRIVPAFTIQAYQDFTKVYDAPSTGIFNETIPAPTKFRFYYNRRELPIAMDYGTHQYRIKWLADIKKLNYRYYLPLFFEGLAEISHPFECLVFQGINEMLALSGNDTLRCLPDLVRHMKGALETRHKKVMLNVCKVMQKLALSSPLVGIALVRHYSDLLHVLRMFKGKNLNIEDHIEYGQRKMQNLGDVIQQTLETLERTGGDSAYLEIKYMVPTYVSSWHN